MDAYLRECGICGKTFLTCRERGFNRQYCEEKCSVAARVESSREARSRDRRRSRRSGSGRERHNAEQRAYRARKTAASVGDQLSRTNAASSIVVGVTRESPIPLITVLAQPSADLEWTVIVVPRLAAVAMALLEGGQVVRCVCCKNSGRVTRVVVKNESPWTVERRARLRWRRGLG